MRVVTNELENGEQIAINLDQVTYATLHPGKDGNLVLHFNDEKHKLVVDPPHAAKVWAALKA